MVSRNIIIFGSAGFIGNHYKTFFEANYPDYKLYLSDLSEDQDRFEADVRKQISIDFNPSPDDIIINLAAVHRTPGHPDFDYFETNIRGAESVCAFAEEHGINNIIFTSSIAPYGASEDLKKEDTLPLPNTPYGISKLTAEYIHKLWFEKKADRKLLILRPGVVFGKGENGNFTRLASAITKGIFFFPGRRDTIKACIYVKDLVLLSWKLFSELGMESKTYNFTYEPAPPISEITNTLARVLDKKQPKILIPSWFLMLAAKTFNFFGLSRIGIHPDRVKKLMTSTNISGAKLAKEIDEYPFGLEEGIKDWHSDCNKGDLY